MPKESFTIPNIACGHCVTTIQKELLDMPGVTQVDGDSGSKQVTVTWEAPATLDEIRQTLKEMNYPASE